MFQRFELENKSTQFDLLTDDQACLDFLL